MTQPQLHTLFAKVLIMYHAILAQNFVHFCLKQSLEFYKNLETGLNLIGSLKQKL
jgi:hypothetical protein